jgi:proteasome assembly chaperone (PAC2) family protein
MAKDDHKVTLTISVDVSELEELSRRMNVLERIRQLEVDLGRLENRLGEMGRAVKQLQEPRGL